MIRLERTLDYGLIRTIMTHPAVYPHISDDFGAAPENFWPMESPALFHLLVWDGEELLGLFITHSINPLLWEVHHCLLPNARGRRAREAGKAYLAWLWENTQAATVFGLTPANNTLALRYARGLGFTEIGRLTGCYLQRSERHDLLIFGRHRPEAKPKEH